VALTQVRKEDNAELEQYAKAFRAAYNDNQDLAHKWGGGTFGAKSTHRRENEEKLVEKEELKKTGL